MIDTTTNPEERLAQLKAERAAVDEERATAERERAILDEIEEQEIGLLDTKALAKAEAEFGTVGKKIAALKTPGSGIGIVIVKRPHHVAFRKWSDTYLGKEAGVPQDAFEELVRPCLVHPDKATFDKYLEQVPALLQRTANVIVKLAGMRGVELSGKA